jgi:transposase
VLTFAPRIRISVCTTRVDMRKSFDGLAVAAREIVGGDPLSGHLFVFFNRGADICKALWWASGGFCLFAKRLARGRFKLPAATPDAKHVVMDAAEFALILEGLDLRDAHRCKRWEPPGENISSPGNIRAG